MSHDLETIRTLRVGGLTIALRTDRPKAFRRLLEFWARLESPRDGAPPDLVYDLALASPEKRLFRDGALQRKPWPEDEDVVAALERDLYQELGRRTPATPLHAAGLAVEGRAVLLVGSSGAGKSSLALALLSRGAAYLGEEHVFFSAGAAQGLPRGIQVWDGVSLEPTTTLPGPDQVIDEATPARLVFLETPRTAQGQLTPLPRAEAMARLALQIQRPPTAADLARLQELVAQAPAATLAHEGPASAANLVWSDMGWPQ